MTRTRKGRDDFVHLLRQVHRTENRKVMEQVVMTEMQKGTPKSLSLVLLFSARRILSRLRGL